MIFFGQMTIFLQKGLQHWLGYIPQTIQSVGETVYAGVQDFANSAHDMVIRAHDALIAAHVEQTHQANQQR